MVAGRHGRVTGRGLATPTALLAASGRGAQLGAGTVTLGQVSVAELWAAEGADEAAVLASAGAVEQPPSMSSAGPSPFRRQSGSARPPPSIASPLWSRTACGCDPSDCRADPSVPAAGRGSRRWLCPVALRRATAPQIRRGVHVRPSLVVADDPAAGHDRGGRTRRPGRSAQRSSGRRVMTCTTGSFVAASGGNGPPTANGGMLSSRPSRRAAIRCWRR